MRSEIRAHVWGLHAVICESFRIESAEDTSPSKDTKSGAMRAFFFAKAEAHPLPPKDHDLGFTFEGQMVDHIYRMLESPIYRRQAKAAREKMQTTLSSDDEKQISAMSEFVDFAMQKYEEGFGAAKVSRLQFLDGNYGGRR